MSTLAMCLPCLPRGWIISSKDIYLNRYRFEMIWIDTFGIAA